MPIGKRCNYCHRSIPIGKQCECRKPIRYKQKKTEDIYLDGRWRAVRGLCIRKCFGLDIFAYYKDSVIAFGFTVHHIYPVEDYPEKEFDPDNLIYVTEQNHRIIHSMLEENFNETVKLLKEYKSRFSAEFGVGGI